jgi:hypothetical protein
MHQPDLIDALAMLLQPLLVESSSLPNVAPLFGLLADTA